MPDSLPPGRPFFAGVAFVTDQIRQWWRPPTSRWFESANGVESVLVRVSVHSFTTGLRP